MSADLYTGTHNGHLMVAALKAHHNDPVMLIDDVTLTGGEVAERVSQYAQAFEGLGAGTGTSTALLALNRPEVLFILGAGQTQGFQRTALHPMGSLDDHAYVVEDAGITTLVVDPVPAFVERALALVERVPSLTSVLTIGPVPDALAGVGHDLVAAAAAYEPTLLTAALLPPEHIVTVTYTGGTTGKPKGVIGTAQSMNTMAQIQLAEWEWPRNPKFLICTPLSHAGAAFFVPTVMKGGCLVVLAKFDFPGRAALFTVILATAIVPFEVYMLPLYLSAKELHLINTLPGIIAPFLVMSFGIFFIRQNVLASIPDELIEAGRIDGASELWIFGRVVFPLLTGPLSALGIFAFMQAWNQFVWPLLVANSKQLYTAEVGLAMFQTGFTVNFGAVSAGSVVSVAPILLVFFLLRRQIIDGVALSGLKG